MTSDAQPHSSLVTANITATQEKRQKGGEWLSLNAAVWLLSRCFGRGGVTGTLSAWEFTDLS